MTNIELTPLARTVDRDLRLDLFRGIGLWMIFLDHIPQDVIAWLTLRNYGFSDAAEVFVFVSGYLAGFIYGPIVRAGDFLAASKRLLIRAWEMYIAHIVLFLAFTAQVSRAVKKYDYPTYGDEFNVNLFLQHPDVLIGKMLTLQYKPVNFDVLPLYILLVALFPVILWCLVRRPNWTLLASVVLYTAAHAFQWNLPSYPPGTGWYFNPFTWQLLFVFAAWCGIGAIDQIMPLVRSRTAMVLSVAWLVFGLVIAISWWFPAADAAVRGSVLNFIYPIDKTYLSVVRLMHFCALAIVVTRYVPDSWRTAVPSYLRPVALCGQHSLPIFCFGVMLSFSAHWILVQFGDRFWQQLGVSAAGILVMIAIAWLLARSAKIPNLFLTVRENGAKDVRQQSVKG